MIPFFPPDLFESDRQALVDIVYSVGTGREQRFILGHYTEQLEGALSKWLGGTQVVACSSGTAGLGLILRAIGIGAGDEVIVPAFGCAPLASAVVNVGARPVFADVDPRTLVLDPDEVEALITPRTRALMPAHVFSVMADMPKMREIAELHRLRLVEDSAVAQGAALDGHPAGRWGDAGVFSFVQVKTFGTAGEGGAVVTDDPDLASRIRMLRNHGQDPDHRFVHHEVGYNSRFDEVLAAFQLHRLPGLENRLERRAKIAEYYRARFCPLEDRGIIAPPPGRNGRFYYVYSLIAQQREGLKRHLGRCGVASHVYYPMPLPYQPAFETLHSSGQTWPNAEHASRCTLAIPVYPHLSDGQVERIADAVCSFRQGRR